jgi:predicted Na+-dependent transporter
MSDFQERAFQYSATQPAKGNVDMSLTLFVVMIVLTVIIAPIALPPIVSALVTGVTRMKVRKVVWSCLVFVIIPLLIGIQC